MKSKRNLFKKLLVAAFLGMLVLPASAGIFEAVGKGDQKAVSDYLIHGGNPNITTPDKITPLMFASDQGHLNIVKYNTSVVFTGSYKKQCVYWGLHLSLILSTLFFSTNFPSITSI